MANNIYALLVGIDEYDPTSTQQVPSLKGCVNDIKAVEDYLRDRITKDGEWKLVEPTNQSWILTNEQATRQAVINGFLEHLCKADSEDVVLFYNETETYWAIVTNLHQERRQRKSRFGTRKTSTTNICTGFPTFVVRQSSRRSKRCRL
jgi:hypothetical protein